MDSLHRYADITRRGCFAIVLLAATGVAAQTVQPQQTPPPAVGPAPAPIVQLQVPDKFAVSVASGSTLKLETSPSSSSTRTPWIPVISSLITGVITLSGAIIGFCFSQRNTRATIRSAAQLSEAALWQKANETEARDIQAKLDGFYGPFMQMSQANFLMAQDLRARSGGPEVHRLLLRMFDQGWKDNLSVGDRALADEICQTAETLRKFIIDKSGMVNGTVVPYLARAAAHFRILHLAGQGKLGTDSAPFVKYIYPRELDRVLELEVSRLKARLEVLRTKPNGEPEPPPSLEIPPDLALPEWEAPKQSDINSA
jgi:hypothetical protein